MLNAERVRLYLTYDAKKYATNNRTLNICTKGGLHERNFNFGQRDKTSNTLPCNINLA